jgi:hydroxylamine reductase
MFCNQCEQVANGNGCKTVGVCGKSPRVAALQDLLMYDLKGLSLYAVEGRRVGVTDKKVDKLICKAIFTTLTNVNFDERVFESLIRECVELRESLKARVKEAGGKEFRDEAAIFIPANEIEKLIEQGKEAGIRASSDEDPDIISLKETLIYGIKGVAAYAYHAYLLGKEDDSIYNFIEEGMTKILRKDIKLEDWINLVLKCGEINLKAMELLDAGNTEKYGHPSPTKVPLGVKKGKAILVSGHDLEDLEEILKQTEGKGINIYTHGEMLPCHGYPGLKKHSHLYGHYGTAWQNQQKEFAKFPGPIVMTTNCLQKPLESYKDHIFTSGPVGYPGITHISDYNFTPVIQKALDMPGFSEDIEGKTVMTGFGRNAIAGVADKIIEAVKGKKIRHFFLVGGCDGARPGRNYYTEFVEKTPKDCIVLTLACGKFRFFDKDLGNIDGIPRLLDVGQCNDAYSAIQIALLLAQAFNVGVNELPLSLIISWYEQKAVSILLTLLHLGIKDIRLGPTLPAFITPNVLDVLVKNYNIKPISTPDEDLKAILG